MSEAIPTTLRCPLHTSQQGISVHFPIGVEYYRAAMPPKYMWENDVAAATGEVRVRWTDHSSGTVCSRHRSIALRMIATARSISASLITKAGEICS